MELDALAKRLTERPQGTLVVTSSLAAAKRLARLAADCPPDLYLGQLPTDPRAFNAVCVCPMDGVLAPGYERAVLADVPAWAVPALEGLKLYRLTDAPGLGAALPDLDQLREAYKALMRITRRPAWWGSMEQLAHMTAEEAGLGDAAAAAAILAMADMGLFELNLDVRPVVLRRLEQAKADPAGSAAWNAMQRWRQGM